MDTLGTAACVFISGVVLMIIQKQLKFFQSKYRDGSAKKCTNKVIVARENTTMGFTRLASSTHTA